MKTKVNLQQLVRSVPLLSTMIKQDLGNGENMNDDDYGLLLRCYTNGVEESFTYEAEEIDHVDLYQDILQEYQANV